MNENLVQHRGEASVWARRKVSDPERWLTGGAALVCMIAASRRRSWAGLLLAMAGGALAWWATASKDGGQRTRCVTSDGLSSSALPVDLHRGRNRYGTPA